MSTPNVRLKTSPTQPLDAKQTAWYQLASAAGALIDNLKGPVTPQNREELLALKEAVDRVMQEEGLAE